jgi:sterol desaturase/sphingolipid hydroxylase (fatty acid hydroxylase superfamily)
VLLIFAVFVTLVAALLASQSGRLHLQTKPRADWLMDGVGLSIQGIIIPLLQMTVVYQLYDRLLPLAPGVLHLSPLVAFLVSFVIVDYLYYWNHRLLHSSCFWAVHQVHHTVTDMDVLGTSRNTVWASFLILYWWVHPLFFYLLDNPTGYGLGASLTSALDLWRHSPFSIPPASWIDRGLSPWLILPQDHAWHHSRQLPHQNYGANFKLWDRLHGTTHPAGDRPSQLGIATPLTLVQQLLFPFARP